MVFDCVIDSSILHVLCKGGICIDHAVFFLYLIMFFGQAVTALSVCSYATHDLYFVFGRFLSVCWLYQIGAFFMLQCLYCLSVPGVIAHVVFCAT